MLHKIQKVYWAMGSVLIAGRFVAKNSGHSMHTFDSSAISK
jgi:hypothetical protein